MRSDESVRKARGVMEDRLEDYHTQPLLRLIFQSKRDALGAVCNQGKDPSEADQNLEQALIETGDELDFPSFIKIQSARNAFAWVQEDLDAI
jgi:hypothetical protein